LIDEHRAYRIQSAGKVGCYGCTSQWLDYDGHAEHLTELIEDQAGWRPPVQCITSMEQADTLPAGSVIVDDWNTVWRRGFMSWFACDRHPDAPARIVLPAIVLHTPRNGDN